MKKTVTLLFFLMSVTWSAFSQDSSIIYKQGTLSKGKVEYDGNTYACDVIAFDASPDVVEGAIKSMMSNRGHKYSTKKGFIVYRNVLLLRTNMKEPVDVFASIEPKSKNEKNKTKVSLIITKPGAIPDKKIDSKTAEEVTTMGFASAGGTIFTDMETEVSLSAHQNDIALQELSVSKATKELKYLEKDANDLQKKLEKLQNDIVENEKARTAAKELLVNETSRLEMLKARKLDKKN
jgi:hypothetical protein